LKKLFSHLLLVLILALSGLPARSEELFKKVSDLNYVPNSVEASQTLDLYIPNDNKKVHPLVIFVHGGGWSAGDKSGAPLVEEFSKYGIAVASLNYRLSTEARFPAQIFDVKAAVRWLRAHAAEYSLDPANFGAWGGSAGGHLVALLGTSNGARELEGNEGNAGQSSYVTAVCDMCGPANFFSLNQPFTPGVLSRPILLGPGKSRYPKKCASQILLGATPDENPGQAKLASPVCWISKNTSPFLIIHGNKDRTVPLNQSLELAALLKAKQIDTTLMVVPNAGHAVGGADVNRSIISFFKQHLLKSP